MSPFGIHADEHTLVLVDGPNLFATTNKIGWDVDFKKLRNHFTEHSMLYRSMYFVPLPEDEVEINPIFKLVDFLDYSGWKIVSKTQREFIDTAGSKRIKGNMQVAMACEMMSALRYVEHVVLFSGDGDLAYAVETVQRFGATVTVVGSVKINPINIADDLRRAVDNFVEIDTVRDIIRKEYNPQVGAVVSSRP